MEARGYLLKSAGREEIVRAVLAVADGDALCGGAIARRVVESLTGTHPRTPARPELTAREPEVLESLSASPPTSQIARRLTLSDKTVSNHVAAVLAKLQASARCAVTRAGRLAGALPTGARQGVVRRHASDTPFVHARCILGVWRGYEPTSRSRTNSCRS
jgi:DNA-binding NarL/FixJ family response regulator